MRVLTPSVVHGDAVPRVRSPELIARICDELPIAVWVAAVPTGEFIYSNQMFCEIMGMTARDDVAVGGYAEPYGICDREGNPYPEDRMPFVQALAAADTVVVDDIVIHRHDGRKVHVRATASPMRDEAGEMDAISIAFIDISAEVEATEAHDRLSEEHRFCLEHMSDLVYRHDSEGVFHYLSPTVERLAGYTREEWEGHYTTFLTDAPGNERVVELTERALATGEKQPPYLVELRHRDGHKITLEVNETPVLDSADGRVTGLVGVGRDVSARIAHERKIERLDEHLRRRTADLERLVYMASHDLRAPLVGIEGFASELADAVAEMKASTPGADAGELPFLAERVLGGVHRLDAMLDGLTRLSRLGRAPFEPRPVNMSALMAEIVETFAWHVREAGAELSVGPLPACVGDPDQVAQIFRNLVDNALKHRHPDRAPRVEVSGALDGDDVVYRVADNGRGLGASELDRVFDPFYRTDPKASPGQGLGLAIARWVAQRLGGRIWAERSEGGGSTFCVRLPR